MQTYDNCFMAAICTLAGLLTMQWFHNSLNTVLILTCYLHVFIPFVFINFNNIPIETY